jgi:hypothetical protein
MTVVGLLIAPYMQHRIVERGQDRHQSRRCRLDTNARSAGQKAVVRHFAPEVQKASPASLTRSRLRASALPITASPNLRALAAH